MSKMLQHKDTHEKLATNSHDVNIINKQKSNR